LLNPEKAHSESDSSDTPNENLLKDLGEQQQIFLDVIQFTKASQPHIFIIDLCEQRPLNNSVTYIFFSAKDQRVLQKLTLDTQKCFV
jgi:hypothetical protein